MYATPTRHEMAGARFWRLAEAPAAAGPRGSAPEEDAEGLQALEVRLSAAEVRPTARRPFCDATSQDFRHLGKAVVPKDASSVHTFQTVRAEGRVPVLR